MNLPEKPLLIAAAVIALGVAAVYFTRSNAPSGELAATPSADAGPDADAPAVSEQMKSAANETQEPAARSALPWEMGVAASPSEGGNPTSPPSAASLGTLPSSSLPDPAQIQKKLNESSKVLDQALTNFNEMEAAGKLPPEVDAHAMRKNLNIAKRAQQLSGEMIALSQQPADDSRSRRIEAIVAELRSLQAQVQFETARAPSVNR